MLRFALLLSLLAIACGGDESSAVASALSDAEMAWVDLKEAEGADYTYGRREVSFTGFGYTTTFRVENDVVVERSYSANDAEGGITETWIEPQSQLGDHVTGHPVKTIDELYDICRTTVLIKPDEQITLEFDEAGVMTTCIYAEPDCQDDCSRGVTINGYNFF